MNAEDLTREADFRSRSTLHLNGGEEFTSATYEILVSADSKLFNTGIQHCTRTDGSPEFKITDQVWFFGDDSFETFDEAFEARRAAPGRLKEAT